MNHELQNDRNSRVKAKQDGEEEGQQKQTQLQQQQSLSSTLSTSTRTSISNFGKSTTSTHPPTSSQADAQQSEIPVLAEVAQESVIPQGFELLAHPVFRRAARPPVHNQQPAAEHGECAICLGKPKRAVKPKACNHVFCLCCLRRWQSAGRCERPTCPVCKCSLRCGLEPARSVFKSNHSSGD